MEESYKRININEYLSDDLFEQELLITIDEFSSPRNENVEHFLKTQAIDFAKKGQSVSYLVFGNSTNEFVGYFTLAVKPITIDADSKVLSNNFRKRIERVCKPNEDGSYTLSAYLIAQLGKNYGVSKSNRIDGKELLKMAHKTVLEIKHRVGGVVVFLECEDSENDFLKNFYLNNGYSLFGERVSDRNVKLYQLVKSI